MHYKQGDATGRKEDKKKPTTTKVAADAQAPNQPLLSKKKKVHAQEQSQISDVHVSGIAVNSNKSTPRNMPPPPPISNPVTQNSSSVGPSQIARPPKSRQGAPNKTPATPVSVSAPNKTGDTNASTSANNPPIPASQREPARRPRPVIASRQFEAALNIAGLATSASERRKQEKEKVTDAVSSSTIDDNDATSSWLPKGGLQVTTSDNRGSQASNVSGSSGLDAEAHSPLPSPKKDRSKRGGRPGSSGRASTQSSGVANHTLIKIPSILQRSDTVANSSAVAPSSNADLNPDINSPPIPDRGTASPPRGRGRRGRGVGGRGFGRGGGRGGQTTTAPRESG